jgi:drug/metabolite transporter (DMT)-like permease
MERILPGQLVAMLIAIAGVFVFMLEKSAAGSRGVSAGDLISLAAAFFFAAYNVAAKPLMARYPATVVTAWALTIGAVPVVLLGLPSLPGQDWGALTSAGWGTLVWSAIFPVYVAWTAWGWVNQQIGVARAAVYMYLVPLVGGVTSWLLLGETFGVQKVAGAALVITGLALARRAGPRPAAAPREAESEQQRAAPRAAT